jgi:Domain of unknown function (DUF932)
MTQILTRDDLRTTCPSIFATAPWERMSEHYRMIPTSEVITILGERGFRPVEARQSRSRIPGKADYTRHMIRFRHDEFLQPFTAGTELPELVMSNSHDGTAAYRFNSGIFRLICSNGLVVASADFGGISVRHKGGEDFPQRIIDATYQIIEETPKTLAQIDEWKATPLTPPQQLALASAAVELLDNPLPPEEVLKPRRDEDKKPDLWTVFNRVQESILKGGIQTRAATGRRTTTRPVKAVDRDIRLNKALWTLATKLAEAVI